MKVGSEYIFCHAFNIFTQISMLPTLFKIASCCGLQFCNNKDECKLYNY